MNRLRSRMDNGELEEEVAPEMGKQTGKAVYARRMGMAMITMCASQYQMVESNEALEKIGLELEREIESMGGVLLKMRHLTTEELKAQWKGALERYVGGDLTRYEAWYTKEVKAAEARRKEIVNRKRAAAALAKRETMKVVKEKEARDMRMQKDREEKEREKRKPSLNVMLHIENSGGERGYATVGNLGVLCGRDAIEDEDGCTDAIGEMVVEAMMVVARKWGFHSVIFTPSAGRWMQFAPKNGRQAECGLKMHVTSADPMHMVEYMRRVNDVKINAEMMEMEREGQDMDGDDNGQRWTQRVQLRTDWGSAELRVDTAPATWDKWQIEVDLGQLKVIESVPHVSVLVEALGDEGIVRGMAEKIFGRATAVF